jgi:hypothetical protein
LWQSYEKTSAEQKELVHFLCRVGVTYLKLRKSGRKGIENIVFLFFEQQILVINNEEPRNNVSPGSSVFFIAKLSDAMFIRPPV